MNHSYYEQPQKSSPLGIRILYQTLPGGFNPLHWHEALEILYPLNGDVELLMDGEQFHLPKKNLTVIESRRAHSMLVSGERAMNICVHISKEKLKNYLPDIELYQITCMPDKISDQQFPAYLEICQMMTLLTKLYLLETPEVSLESEGIILQVLAHLIRHFGIRAQGKAPDSNQLLTDRIHQILSWVETHYSDPISLSDVADQLAISREYFCRLFRQSMGITFQEYLTGLRLNHAYQDLLYTTTPVSEIMENNGFTNQKRFNASFKKLYGCTPSEVRRQESKHAT